MILNLEILKSKLINVQVRTRIAVPEKLFRVSTKINILNICLSLICGWFLNKCKFESDEIKVWMLFL